MPDAPWSLAIDFGTTNTAAAYVRNGQVQAIQLGPQSNLMPSSVLRSGDTFVVGRAAENQMLNSPENFEPYPKLLLGRTETVLGGVKLAPEALVAAVLRWVRTKAERVAGSPAPERVWLTHPAEWTHTQRNALRRAAELAGFHPETLILASEPIAAAAYYAENAALKPGDKVAVFDCGGGTSDVAVLEVGTAGMFDFRVVASAGDERLGGNDLDDRVWSWVIDQIGEPARGGVLDSPELLGERLTLRSIIRGAKEDLSDNPSVPIGVRIGAIDKRFSLTQDDYEGLISHEVARAGELLERVLQSSGVTAEQLAAIYLTGGSSQTPAIMQEIERVAGQKPATLLDPKLVVAVGALHLPESAATPAIAPPPSPPNPEDRRPDPEPVVGPVPLPEPEPEIEEGNLTAMNETEAVATAPQVAEDLVPDTALGGGFPPQPPHHFIQQPPPPPRKSNVGLIVGLAAGIPALILIISLVAFLASVRTPAEEPQGPDETAIADPPAETIVCWESTEAEVGGCPPLTELAGQYWLFTLEPVLDCSEVTSGVRWSCTSAEAPGTTVTFDYWNSASEADTALTDFVTQTYGAQGAIGTWNVGGAEAGPNYSGRLSDSNDTVFYDAYLYEDTAMSIQIFTSVAGGGSESSHLAVDAFRAASPSDVAAMTG